MTCNAFGACETFCRAQCVGKECGSDGCGGSCGTCVAGQECSGSGKCEDTCVTDCSGKGCGDDGCGGSCGTCVAGQECSGSGKCEDTCVTDCSGKECGDDDCGGSCGDCELGSACEDGACVECKPDCDDKVCGDDGCDGSCGVCPTGKVCGVSGQCEEPCVAECLGKECGDDGCGGSCAECVQGYYCDQDFKCVEGCQPVCDGKACGDDGCGGVCGECTAPAVCEAGQCVGCDKDCQGKECGGDGCGGSCGECGTGKMCGPQGLCVDFDPCPVWGELACGGSVSGTNEGQQSVLDDYECTFYEESGPEVIYSFVGDKTQFVTAAFKVEPAEDLDILVMDASCDPATCLVYGNDDVKFKAEPGVTYLVVVDGFQGAVSPFELDIDCCIPDCTGKACDEEDGCGTECGCTQEGYFCVEKQCIPPTCDGFCDTYSSPFECSCASWCFTDGTCCDDICQVCGDVFVEDCCVPDCAGKDCGGDGCGGSCGLCLAGTKCQGGLCAPCDPQCDGKACGDDDCNGSCGECATGQVCVIGGQCAVLDKCTVFAQLQCGGVVEGANTGLVDFLNDYSCSTWNEDGPEMVFTFTGDKDQQVTVSFTESPDEDLDIMVLDSVCETSACLEYGTDEATFDAVASQTYYVVVDGYELAEDDFSLDVECCVVDCTGKTCDQDNGCGTLCGCGESDQECVAGVCTTATCAGLCGEISAPFGCYCDIDCFYYLDCCEDICETCKDTFPDDCP